MRDGHLYGWKCFGYISSTDYDGNGAIATCTDRIFNNLNDKELVEWDSGVYISKRRHWFDSAIDLGNVSDVAVVLCW